jgi:hypothetical protein
LQQKLHRVQLQSKTLYYQDRPTGFSELSFRFQPGAAATQRPANETNVFITGYTESAMLFDVMNVQSF